MTIAIVDDELETRQYMQGLVAQYLAETGRMAQLVFYPDGASFLVGCEHPDIVLMDIDMPGMDGLSTAEQLRRSHPDAILIFTTRLSQCAIRGYEVDAIGFPTNGNQRAIMPSKGRAEGERRRKDGGAHRSVPKKSV